MQFKQYTKKDKVYSKLIIIMNYTLTNLKLLGLSNILKIVEGKAKAYDIAYLFSKY